MLYVDKNLNCRSYEKKSKKKIVILVKSEINFGINRILLRN